MNYPLHHYVVCKQAMQLILGFPNRTSMCMSRAILALVSPKQAYITRFDKIMM